MSQQRSSEWDSERIGVLTGTRAAALMGGKAARKTLLAEMVREVAMASKKGIYQSQSMKKGVDDEAEAREYYEFINDVKITDYDTYIVSDFHHRIAVSPDGLITDCGGIEIKNLEPHNHIAVMLDGEVDKKYEHQIYWAIMICKTEWWDYFGYCKELPDNLKAYTKKYYAEPKIIDNYKTTALEFLAEFEATLERFDLII